MKIAGLGYVVIGALDVERWRRFGVEMLGMAAFDAAAGALYFKMDEYHHRYLIVPHASDVFLASAWEVANKAAYEAARTVVVAAQIAIEFGTPQECALRKVQEFFRCNDPSGNRLEIFWGPIGDFSRFVSPIGVGGFVTGDMGMGHVVLPAPQFESTRKFWLEVLNFGLSDFVNYDMGAGQPPVRINFLHCDNPREHSVALVEMANPCGCDHLLVEVSTIDEVGARVVSRRRSADSVASDVGAAYQRRHDFFLCVFADRFYHRVRRRRQTHRRLEQTQGLRSDARQSLGASFCARLAQREIIL